MTWNLSHIHITISKSPHCELNSSNPTSTIPYTSEKVTFSEASGGCQVWSGHWSDSSALTQDISPEWRPCGQVWEERKRWQLGDHGSTCQQEKNRASDRVRQKSIFCCLNYPRTILKESTKLVIALQAIFHKDSFKAGISFCRAVWLLWGRVHRFGSASAEHERQNGRCNQIEGHRLLKWAATHPIAEGASSAIHPSQMSYAQGSNTLLQFVSTVHVSGLFARILFIVV